MKRHCAFCELMRHCLTVSRDETEETDFACHSFTALLSRVSCLVDYCKAALWPRSGPRSGQDTSHRSPGPTSACPLALGNAVFFD